MTTLIKNFYTSSLDCFIVLKAHILMQVNKTTTERDYLKNPHTMKWNFTK